MCWFVCGVVIGIGVFGGLGLGVVYGDVIDQQ